MLKELIAAAIGISAISAVVSHSREEERRRTESPFSFPDCISEDDFESIAYSAARIIKKRNLKISVNGPVIYGSFASQSGLSTYNFSVDFNDYGKLTGQYWIRTGNSDSTIPTKIASIIRDEIENRLND